MTARLKDKVAIVTGASRGIREAIIVSLLFLPLSAVAACDCEGRDQNGEAPPAETAPLPETSSSGEETPEAMPLYVAPGDIDFGGNQRLLDRLRGSAHGYFRFINVAFSEQLCQRFADDASTLPSVNLHGDAHVEQYAITSIGRGLTDYDDSSTGPGFLDLVRFGTSLRLTCEERGWQQDEQGLLDEFLRGYEEALQHPDRIVPEPAFATEIRNGFSRDRTEFLAWVDEIMVELEPNVRRRFDFAVRDYLEAMREQHADLGADFFTIKKVGTHPLGIGSALDRKFVARIEGPTADPLDDVILEAKEVRDLSGISCISHSQNLDPFRVLVGQARIAFRPYPYLGYATIDGDTFWIHGWADNYHEMDIEEFESPQMLRTIAYDVGLQLGRGHVNQIAAPLDAQFCRAQRNFIEEHREDLQEAVIEMTQMTIAAWERFAAESADLELTPTEP